MIFNTLLKDIIETIAPDKLGYNVDGIHVEVELTKEEQEEWVKNKGDFYLTREQIVKRGVIKNER